MFMKPTLHVLFLLCEIVVVRCLHHRLGQNSILSRVKMMLISRIVCEKKQRLEVARGFTLFTSQFYLLHTIPTQPVNSFVIRSGSDSNEPPLSFSLVWRRAALLAT